MRKVPPRCLSEFGMSTCLLQAWHAGKASEQCFLGHSFKKYHSENAPSDIPKKNPSESNTPRVVPRIPRVSHECNKQERQNCASPGMQRNSPQFSAVVVVVTVVFAHCFCWCFCFNSFNHFSPFIPPQTKKQLQWRDCKNLSHQAGAPKA